MAVKRLRLKVNDRWHDVEVDDSATSPVRVVVDGKTYHVEVDRASTAPSPTSAPPMQAPSRASSPSSSLPLVPSSSSSSPLPFRAPMPGRIIAVSVRPGDRVKPGDEVCIIEAMKMEQSLRVSREGTVKAVHVKTGQQVKAGDLLVEFE